MAGYYADIPGDRFALDIDGTLAMVKTTSAPTWTDVTSQLGAVVNNLGGSITFGAGGYGTGELGLLFPEPRTLTGAYWRGWNDKSAGNVSAVYSTDTTDLVNGTWQTMTPNGGIFSGANDIPLYRKNIAALNYPAVTGVRLRVYIDGWGTNVYWIGLHLYGTRDTSSDRMAVWDASSDQAMSPAALDFGDVLRGQTHGPRQFRVKNLSSTLTATGATVAAEDMGNVGFGTNGLQVSTDGTTWASSINIGNLSPGQISAPLYVRLNLDSALAAQGRSGRLVMSAASWS